MKSTDSTIWVRISRALLVGCITLLALFGLFVVLAYTFLR